MSNIANARQTLLARIVGGDGKAPTSQRRAAFANAELPEPLRTLVEKVVVRSHAVTDRDTASVLASGLSEDQVFELVVCAAVGEATRQYDVASAALDAAIESQ